MKSNEEWLYLTGQLIVANKNESSLLYYNPDLFSLEPNQLLVADIYVSWSGPCKAVESTLRRIRNSETSKPNSLMLAKVCCDDIEDLKDFRDDPRPTFLFWARGRPVALLRGVNRPLLTRLVLQEVRLEEKESERDFVDIDFRSDHVIQCQGTMASLADDKVVQVALKSKFQISNLIHTCIFL